MTEEQYRDLDYCICRYNCYFPNRKRISRGDVLQKFLESLYLPDGKIDMNKFIAFVQSK